MTRSSRSHRQHDADRLKRLREALGFSQREIAEEFKVAHGAIAQWESAKRGIPGPVLKLMELYETELGMSQDKKKEPDLNKAGELSSLKSSWLSRSLRLSTTAAGVTARLAGSALEQIISRSDDSNVIAKRAQEAVARQLLESLGELKGLAMKMGQMVSYLDFALPENAREVLTALQAASKPMSPSVIAQVIQEELGEPPGRIFAEWTPNPIAAASIGQVHRARLSSGMAVAVKVQYPGIAKTLEADLKNTSLLDQLGSVLFRGQERGSFVGELRERLMEECDYRKEAANQEHFRGLFWGREGILIPSVVTGLSSGRVLTTEFIEAENFASFLAHASQEERNAAGERIWDVAFESIFRHHIFNGDPHPGNYLFSPGGVVFLDFGCVRRFSPEFVATWKRAVRAVFEQNREAARRLFQEMGFVADPRRYDFEYHYNMMVDLYEPWLHERKFRFNPEFVTRTWRKMAVENPNKFRMNLPPEWVFLNRLQWGLYSVLSALGAESDWRSRMLSLIYEPGEAWPAPHDR